MAKVRYEDLTTPLKVAVVMALIVGTLEILSFIWGFLVGFSSTI